MANDNAYENSQANEKRAYLPVFIRVRGELREKIEAEMKEKELPSPSSIVLSALRKRYEIEIPTTSA